jgi:hypothetical protein
MEADVVSEKKIYLVSTVWKRPMGGYSMTLRDPDEQDDDGEQQYVGGFTFVEDGIPPIEGGTVEVIGTLGTRTCIIEWDRGRLVKNKYEGKETST